MLYPTCFLVFFRVEELSLFISYRGMSAATIFSTDKFSDFIDIPLLYLLSRFLCFLCQLFHMSFFVSSDLSLDTPVGFCICRPILHSTSSWSAVIYLLLQLAPLLDSLPRVWCNPFFHFSSLLHPQTGFTCFIKDVPHLPPLLIYSVFFFNALLVYVIQGLEPVP